MNEIVNTFLLVGDKFITEMHLNDLILLIVLAVLGLIYSAKELKNLCKQEIQIMFTKMTLIKFVFNMIWLMVNLKIWLEELNQIKF